MGTNMKNDPKSNMANWYFIDVKVHTDSWVVQTACLFNMDYTAPTFVRKCHDGDWKAWRLFNPGTANTAQVLSGYTFSSANGVNLSGTLMPVVTSVIGDLYPPYSYTYTVSTSGYYVFIISGLVRYNDPNSGTNFFMTKNGNTISPNYHCSHTAYQSGGGVTYVSNVVKCGSGDIIKISASGNHYTDSSEGSQVYFGYVRI